MAHHGTHERCCTKFRLDWEMTASKEHHANVSLDQSAFAAVDQEAQSSRQDVPLQCIRPSMI